MSTVAATMGLTGSVNRGTVWECQQSYRNNGTDWECQYSYLQRSTVVPDVRV